MLDANRERLLREIPDHAKVLDVGGWYIPFPRADYVVDLAPYATRTRAEDQGVERFSANTWIELDVCSERLPFDDDSFDYVICSHTLEDIRDPLFLCRELNRVAKAGYLETPSITAELTFGVFDKGYAGWPHHRWLVEMQDQVVTFRHKPHFIHGHWRYHLPKRIARGLSDEQKATWMFWEGGFEYREIFDTDPYMAPEETEAFVRSSSARPESVYAWLPVARGFTRIRERIGAFAYRHLRR